MDEQKTGEMIESIVNSLRVRNADTHDLVQAGWVAALEAEQTWDAEKGEFTAYAWRFVKTAVVQENTPEHRREDTTRLGRRLARGAAKALRDAGGDIEKAAKALDCEPDALALHLEERRVAFCEASGVASPTYTPYWDTLHEMKDAFEDTLDKVELDIYRHRIFTERPVGLRKLSEMLRVGERRLAEIDNDLRERLEEFKADSAGAN